MGFGKLRYLLSAEWVAGCLSERERWVLWLPVALGAGIALYFALPDEPARWIGPLVLLNGMVLAGLARRHPAAWVSAVVVAVAALGFTLAVERSHRVAAPVLQAATGIIALEGRIAEVEPVEGGERLILEQLDLPPLRREGPVPRRIRLRLPEGVEGFRAGQRLSLRASLSPPSMPAAPGAYDFARTAWFQRIGAVGFAVLPIAILPDPPPSGWAEGARLWLAHRRHELTLHIVAAIDGAGLPAGTGATAAALVTGERGPVPAAVLAAYRDAGLAHILVIAGMHMSMVAGLAFVAIRAGLAAIPPIALRYPIKKWTAAAALLVALAYLVISGAPVPTQRAFMMNAIVMTAVLLDREALSLRSITWAALAVLATQPEVLVGASFQMSFSAVYALISAYETLGPRLTALRRRWRDWWAAGPAFHLLGILLTTLVAASGTAVYTAFHFNRYGAYALLGNGLAVPLVGLWVMPCALLAMVLLPFGLDGWAWQGMGWGLVAVTRIARMVSSLPGATLDLPAMPVGALALFTLGGLWLLLWRSSGRLLGLAGMAAAFVWWGLVTPPDLLVSPSGKVAALRGADGRLTLSSGWGGKRLRETWTRRAGQGEESEDIEDRPDVACDTLGCIWHVKGHVVALVRRPEALLDDCLAADLVVVPVPVRLRCPSARLMLDRSDLQARGSHAIWLDPAGGVAVLSTADAQGNRPWSHHRPVRQKRQPAEDEAPPTEAGDEETAPAP